ncbi:hypothetical protein Tco_1446828 [Tanacetum coccineum]
MRTRTELTLEQTQQGGSEEVLVDPHGFKDVDHAGCLDTRKNTYGGIQFLGDKMVSWMSKKKDCVAMSTIKDEYVALSASCAQVLWMRTQLKDHGFDYKKIPMYCDSQSAITISCNPVQHSCFKHINVRYHFIKEEVEKGIVELEFLHELSPEQSQHGDSNDILLLGFKGKHLKLLLFTLQVDINNSPLFVCYPNLQGNSDIGTAVEYQKALLASLDVSTLDKTYFQLENLLRRFIHESNPNDACTYNGVTTSSSTIRLTTTCSYSSFKDIQLASRVQEIKKAQNKQRRRPSTRSKKTIGTSREIVRFQNDAKYEHVGSKHKAVQGWSRKKVPVFKRRLECRPLLSSSSTKDLRTKDKVKRQ